MRADPDKIDMFRPQHEVDACIKAVSDVLRSRFIGQGPVVDQFEREFGARFRVQYPVSLNSGTAALATAYELIGIGPGDKVISTPLTCTATNEELLRLGAKIIWADILEDTLCIDPEDVKRKLKENDGVKAVVQVHLGGIRAMCGNLPVPVVSDAAQALGIFDGDYTCCSFQAIKHITTGDGGMLVVGDAESYRRAKLKRWFGIDREKKIANDWHAYKERAMTFQIQELGTKRQMNDIAAAMGMVGMKQYPDMMRYRAKLFSLYKNLLRGVPGVKIVDGPENTWWLCTILVENRDGLMQKFFRSNPVIDCNLVQLRNDLYDVFGGKRADLPIMNAVEEKYLSIPIGLHVTEDDVGYICGTIKGGW